MLDEMWVNDEQLDVSDIRRLERADEIAHFWGCQDNCVTFFHIGTRSPNRITN
jgi:hypothetical protein